VKPFSVDTVLLAHDPLTSKFVSEDHWHIASILIVKYEMASVEHQHLIVFSFIDRWSLNRHRLHLHEHV